MSVWFSLSLSLWNLFFFFESPSFLLVFSFWNMNFFVDFLFVKTINSVWNNKNNLKIYRFDKSQPIYIIFFFLSVIFQTSVEFVRLLIQSNSIIKRWVCCSSCFLGFSLFSYFELAITYYLSKISCFLKGDSPQFPAKNSIATW